MSFFILELFTLPTEMMLNHRVLTGWWTRGKCQTGIQYRLYACTCTSKCQGHARWILYHGRNWNIMHSKLYLGALTSPQMDFEGLSINQYSFFGVSVMRAVGFHMHSPFKHFALFFAPPFYTRLSSMWSCTSHHQTTTRIPLPRFHVYHFCCSVRANLQGCILLFLVKTSWATSSKK